MEIISPGIKTGVDSNSEIAVDQRFTIDEDHSITTDDVFTNDTRTIESGVYKAWRNGLVSFSWPIVEKSS